MDLEASISEVFCGDGLLQREVPEYVERYQQIEMAIAIASALEQKSNALIEAGTGTGKTFAYLVPILLQKKNAIVSTGTKTLQDQLYYQDLPTILNLLGLSCKVSLLKGRSNYLCPERLAKNIKVMSQLFEPEVLASSCSSLSSSCSISSFCNPSTLPPNVPHASIASSSISAPAASP